MEWIVGLQGDLHADEAATVPRTARCSGTYGVLPNLYETDRLAAPHFPGWVNRAKAVCGGFPVPWAAKREFLIVISTQRRVNKRGGSGPQTRPPKNRLPQIRRRSELVHQPVRPAQVLAGLSGPLCGE